MLVASWVMGGTMEPIVPSWLQAAGHQSAGRLARPSCARREKPHHHRRWDDAGLLERLLRQATLNCLVLKGVERAGCLEHGGGI
jgi:hypothetical protein